MIGLPDAPVWLDADWLLSQFGRQRQGAIDSYRRFIMEGMGLPSLLAQTRHQLFLGGDAFVVRHRQDKKPEELREVSKVQHRSLALLLDDYRRHYQSRNEAMAQAYLSGAYTMLEIGEHFGVYYMSVSRAVRQFEQDKQVMLECETPFLCKLCKNHPIASPWIAMLHLADMSFDETIY